MPEEPKSPSPPPPGNEQKPGADKQSGAVQPVPPADKTAPPAVPPKAAAPPAKPSGPVPVPWDSPLVATLRRQYGSGISEASTYLSQNYMVVDTSILIELLQV